MTGRAARWWWVIFLTLLPATLAAQDEPAEATRWAASLHYEAQQIAREPDEAYWHTVTAGIQRSLRGGSIAVQAVTTRRFDIDDQALVADAYHDLWAGAYANARVRYAPGAETLPVYALAAEVFQTIASSEISASYQHQEFAVADVNTFGLGLGQYVGAGYLRLRSIVARIDDTWSPFVAFSARRYLGDTTDNSVELSLGIGEEVLEVAAPTGAVPVDVITTSSRFAALSTQRFFSRNLGATAGASISDYGNIPTRWGLSMGVITRW
jgi:YaiO family outer membrane protein